jgi:hypothetical protein
MYSLCNLLNLLLSQRELHHRVLITLAVSANFVQRLWFSYIRVPSLSEAFFPPVACCFLLVCGMPLPHVGVGPHVGPRGLVLEVVGLRGLGYLCYSPCSFICLQSSSGFGPPCGPLGGGGRGEGGWSAMITILLTCLDVAKVNALLRTHCGRTHFGFLWKHALVIAATQPVAVSSLRGGRAWPRLLVVAPLIRGRVSSLLMQRREIPQRILHVLVHIESCMCFRSAFDITSRDCTTRVGA